MPGNVILMHSSVSRRVKSAQKGKRGGKEAIVRMREASQGGGSPRIAGLEL